MNSLDSSNEKSSTIIYKYECLDCENYKRKVKEAEQTVSGRDVLIEMLQQEIKKMEERYKTSIDDYEKLRFKYCTVVQDLGNLKEIHKKLEKSNAKLVKERDIARNHLEILNKEIDKCQKQCKVPPSKPIPKEDEQIKKNIKDSDSIHQNILKEVMNMEVIMQNQNETVKDVLLKVLNEMKGVKGSKQIEEVLQKSPTYNTSNENISDQGNDKLLKIIEDLNKQVAELNTIVEKLKLKNETIVNEITEKKSNLAQCLNVLEDNHSSLNQLSGNIEIIVNEKETLIHETLQLKKIIEENEKTLQIKDKEISDLKSKVDSIGKVPEIESMRRRNEDLQKALNECEKDLEKLQEEYLETEKQCTIEKCTQIAKTLLEAKNYKDVDTTTKSEMNAAEKKKEKSSETENKGTDVADEHGREINSLKEKIVALEHNLEQAKLENSEYEEENKYYSQKVENLSMQLQELETEKLEWENKQSKSFTVAELKENFETLASQKENEIKQLKSEINNLMTNGQEEYLKNQLINLQNELAVIQEKDEQHILNLQDKIDKLENAQYQKQIEIDQCCCVVQDIKDKLADKNYIDESNLVQITFLEDQKTVLQKDKQQLQKYIADLQKEISVYQHEFKDCNCKFGKQESEKDNLKQLNSKLQNDVKELEVELCRRECLHEKLQKDVKEMDIDLCRKQCTINHLEQCLDKSNKILAECEKEMKEMHLENENARKENEALKKELQNHAFDIELSSSEKKDLQSTVTKLHRQSQDLEMENGMLSMSLQEKTTVEDELSQVKKTLNNVMKTSKEKDEELKRLQTALESSKKEYEKMMRVYKELKETLSQEIKKYKDEVEKMIKEKDSSFNVDNNSSIMELRKLQSLIEEKQKIIGDLEHQNHQLGAEVAQLKAHVHKVITDNKNLRTAIENLLATLVEKLKGFTDNEDRISLKSNEVIVQDILNSLVDLENSVTISNSTSTEKCNCMSVIMSTYKGDLKDAKTRNIPPCKQRCGKRIRDVAKYVNSKTSTSQGIINTCQYCCEEREKGQDDIPESRSRATL